MRKKPVVTNEKCTTLIMRASSHSMFIAFFLEKVTVSRAIIITTHEEWRKAKCFTEATGAQQGKSV